MMKRILIITATLVLCSVITIAPAFAIQSGFYNGETMVHLLGAQYQVELMGVGDDALVLFDTRDMYWYAYDGYRNSSFDSDLTSMTAPDVIVTNTVETYFEEDLDKGLVYNDLVLTIDFPSFPTGDTIATTYMISDRFEFSNTSGGYSRIGLHLNPVYNTDTNEYLYPAGSVIQGQITLYALTELGEIYEQTIGRDDLVVGGTYDLRERLQEFNRDVVQGVVQYYWIEYEGEGVIPTFVQDIYFELDMPFSSVRVIDYATSITYPEYVDYTDFNLLQWISTAVDGFMRAPLFVLGDFTVTLGAVLAVGIAVPIFVAFLRRYAGG